MYPSKKEVSLDKERYATTHGLVSAFVAAKTKLDTARVHVSIPSVPGASCLPLH